MIQFLLHRYAPSQFNLAHVKSNYRLLVRRTGQEWLDCASDGELRLISTRWERCIFSLKNALVFGAYRSRLEKVIYYTYLTLTLELNNPFDKKILSRFLDQKKRLLERLLDRNVVINGKRWNQERIRIHLDVFYRASLLQYEIVKKMQKAVRRQKEPEIIKEAKRALQKGLYPILITEGFSGAYWMRGDGRRIVGLFKPFDEEIHAPNNPIGGKFQGPLGRRATRYGCRVGEAAHHEVAAYLVDAFFGLGLVPRTYYAEFSHHIFFLYRENRLGSRLIKKQKLGSFQEYVEGFISLKEVMREERRGLPIEDFQLLVVLDVIIGNTDRNAGNILIGDEQLAAIDHGLCFSDQHEEFGYWYWRFDVGEKPLYPSLLELLEDFPFQELGWKLKKNCFISEPSLQRMRERVVLFRKGCKAGLEPNQLCGLMMPKYLYPLWNSGEVEMEVLAREQVELYLSEDGQG